MELEAQTVIDVEAQPIGIMAYFKVKIQRECKTTRTFNVTANKSQEALLAAALQLRDEGVADAKGIEVIGQINSLRD
jgi:hypothetical protein